MEVPIKWVILDNHFFFFFFSFFFFPTKHPQERNCSKCTMKQEHLGAMFTHNEHPQRGNCGFYPYCLPPMLHLVVEGKMTITSVLTCPVSQNTGRGGISATIDHSYGGQKITSPGRNGKSDDTRECSSGSSAHTTMH